MAGKWVSSGSLANVWVIPATTAPDWWLSGAAIDLKFTTSQYYDGADGADVTTLLSCSRASIGYAQTAAGTLTQFAANELRITDLGLLVEDTRTNVVLWNRDLTNGAWTPTNITAVKDQTGPDGVGNAASSITATAGNGTILQAITLASSARYQSAWVKRITGSGTIEMTMDNGATWTAITVTSSWTQVTIPTQTLANPTVGFRIVTSGDAIAVDFVQNEDGTFVSSPIPTTTVAAARAADVVTCIGSLNAVLTGGALSAIADFTFLVMPTTYWGIVGAGANYYMMSHSISDIYMDSTTTGQAELVATLNGTFRAGIKTGFAADGTGKSIVGGGGTVASDAFYTAATAPRVGESSFGRFRRLTAWTSRLADATLQTLTSP